MLSVVTTSVSLSSCLCFINMKPFPVDLWHSDTQTLNNLVSNLRNWFKIVVHIIVIVSFLCLPTAEICWLPIYFSRSELVLMPLSAIWNSRLFCFRSFSLQSFQFPWNPNVISNIYAICPITPFWIMDRLRPLPFWQDNAPLISTLQNR